MGPGRALTHDPWICSQTGICCQTRYQLRYTVQSGAFLKTSNDKQDYGKGENCNKAYSHILNALAAASHIFLAATNEYTVHTAHEAMFALGHWVH